MAAVAKVGLPSPATITYPHNCEISGKAGENIAAGDACYVKSDGFIWRSLDAANAGKEVDGLAPQAYLAGRGATILYGLIMAYGSGLTPGASLFLSSTVPGGLDTVVGTNQTKPIGVVLPDGQNIKVCATR